MITDANPKDLYKIINKIAGKDKSTQLPEHNSAGELANEFSDFFATKIEKIRSQFSENDQFNVFDRKAKSSLSSFKILSEADVTKIIKASKNKTCDLDPVPIDIVKRCLSELVTPITSIINKSRATGFMPSVLKEAVLTPLIKKAKWTSRLQKLSTSFKFKLFVKTYWKGSCKWN